MKTLSLNKPTPPKPKAHALDLFVGRRIVLQAGPVTYTGELHAITASWLVFKDATVTGNRRIAQVSEVLVGKNLQFAHVHLEADVTGIEVVV